MYKRFHLYGKKTLCILWVEHKFRPIVIQPQPYMKCHFSFALQHMHYIEIIHVLYRWCAIWMHTHPQCRVYDYDYNDNKVVCEFFFSLNILLNRRLYVLKPDYGRREKKIKININNNNNHNNRAIKEDDYYEARKKSHRNCTVGYFAY